MRTGKKENSQVTSYKAELKIILMDIVMMLSTTNSHLGSPLVLAICKAALPFGLEIHCCCNASSLDLSLLLENHLKLRNHLFHKFMMYRNLQRHGDYQRKRCNDFLSLGLKNASVNAATRLQASGLIVN